MRIILKFTLRLRTLFVLLKYEITSIYFEKWND